MASYHGPKAKVQRRFGEALMPRPKYQRILEKRAYPPGDHGKEKQFRSGRRSAYGQQLDEKQKLAYIYNIRDRQLRSYYLKADQMQGRTGANLLSLLERRLDNLVYKAGFGATIWAARQLVGHGHITVNGRRVNLPSYQCVPGDVIGVSEKMKKNVHIEEWVQQVTTSPAYLDVDRENLTATFSHLPEGREIFVPLDIQLVVEYYNRLT